MKARARGQPYDQAIGVAGEGRVASGSVDVAAARHGQHRLELVVLDRDERQARPARRARLGCRAPSHDELPEHLARARGGRRGGEAGDDAERHPGAARHRDVLQVEAALDGDAERGEVGREVERRRVLVRVRVRGRGRGRVSKG